MAWLTIRSLVTLARLQRKPPSIRDLGFQHAFQAKNYVPFRAPVIGLVARRVFHHPHADFGEVLRSPKCRARFAGVFGWRDRAPVGGGESESVHLHGGSIVTGAKEVAVRPTSAAKAGMKSGVDGTAEEAAEKVPLSGGFSPSG